MLFFSMLVLAIASFESFIQKQDGAQEKQNFSRKSTPIFIINKNISSLLIFFCIQKVEILDESTGQIILKEQARLIYTSPLSKISNDINEIDNEVSLVHIYSEKLLTHHNSTLPLGIDRK